MGASGWRDRNGIMYFAQGGVTTSPPGGYGGGYGQPPPILPGGSAPGTNPSYGAGAGDVASGTQATMFGSLPYNSGVPMTNAFVANAPTSNMNFNAGQFSPALNQSYGNLSQLQSMLLNQSQGGGPNPAAEQLKQSTNANISRAYAMAQASPNNSATALNLANNANAQNQQAASDASIQRMQQQLASQGLLSQTGLGLFGTSGRLLTDAQKLQLEQAQGNQQAALNAQGINAATSLGNQQYGANVVGSAINAGGAVLGHIFSGNGGNKSGGGGGTDPGSYPDVTPAPDMSGTQGDFPGGGGDMYAAAYGGMIPPRHYDEGGYVSPYAPNASPADFTDYSGKSEVGDMAMPSNYGAIGGYGQQRQQKDKASPWGQVAEGVASKIPVFGAIAGGIASNNATQHMFDSPSALGSPGVRAQIAARNKAIDDQYGNLAMFFHADGGAVPGQASKAGNNYENDTVKAMLSPGEIVLPRSVTQSPDAAEKAKEFVEAIRARKKKS